MTEVITLGSMRVVAPQRNPVRGEAYSAARGAGLIGLAVVVGFVLFQVVDSPGTSSGGGNGGTAGTGDETVVTQETLPPTGGGTARPPDEFTTIVLNASGEGGAAAILSNELVANGYNTLTPNDAPLQDATTVQCQEGYEAEADVLAVAVGGGTVEPYEPPPAGVGAEEAICVVYLGPSTAPTEET